ncbi:MAG: hypothetical protein IJV24_00470 [Prevotella sp.]|nr:hypothetical protein [Prevotella sp.]
MEQQQAQWAENIILADADHIDKVAFDLIVNFERMLGRRIPQADMPRWAECIALDGGLRQGDNQTNVILIHDKDHSALSNFTPANYHQELNGQAFNGPLGEFVFSSIPTSPLADKLQLFADTLTFLLSISTVKRLMVIPDESNYQRIHDIIRKADCTDKHITVFAMQPMPGGHFAQEILGFSLLSALGIKPDEIRPDA